MFIYNTNKCLFIYFYFFFFLYHDELVCSHLDGIFIKENSLISILAFVLLFFSHQLLA